MSFKKSNLFINRPRVTLPLTIYEKTYEASPIIQFNTSCSFVVNISGSIPANNLVENYGFEYPIAAGSTIDDWTPEYPYWSRFTSGCSAFGERYASASLIINDIGRNITSASFSVTEDLYYDFAICVKSINGKIYYTNPTTGVSGREDTLAQYGGYVLWQGSGSNLIFSGSGKTVLGEDITDYVSNKYPDLYIPEDWKLYRASAKAPSGCDTGSLVFYGNYATPTTYTSSAYGDVIKPPTLLLDNIYALPKETAFVIGPTIAFNTIVEDMFIITPSASTVDVEHYVPGATGDCTGESISGVFNNDGYHLYGGCSSTNGNLHRSWIPFELDFSSATTGIHIDTAYLTVVASQYKQYSSQNPCKLSVGFENTIDPSAPTTNADLFARAMNSSPTNTTITESWVEGQTYTFNITNSAKALLGTNGITWTNGSGVGVIIKDWGSALGSYQTIASFDNPYYSAPQLTINYAQNFYDAEVYDLTIKTDGTYEDDTILDIGHDNSNTNRGLLKFNITDIPAGSTVTTACLVLVQSDEFATTSSSMCIYPMAKQFDLYTATWYKQYGTELWSSAGCGYGTDIDSSSGSIGYLNLSASELDGEKKITLDTATVQDWVDNPENNLGMIMIMGNESEETTHRFTSSQNPTTTSRPYFYFEGTIGGDHTILTVKNGEVEVVDNTPDLLQITRLYKEDYSTLGPLTIPAGLHRYILLFRTAAGTSQFTSLSLGGLNFTQIGIGTRTVTAEAWGLVIPDSWSGEKVFVSTTSGTSFRTTYMVFNNVNPTTPILDYAVSLNYASFSTPQSVSTAVSSNSYGAVYDVIAFENNTSFPTRPACGANQISLYTKENVRGVSRYGTVPTGTTTMSWSIDKSRNVHIPVSLNPYGS